MLEHKLEVFMLGPSYDKALTSMVDSCTGLTSAYR